MGKRVRVKSLKFLIVFLCTTGLLFSSINYLQNIAIIKGELRLQFADICNKKDIKKFALTKPNRLVFDLHHTRLERCHIDKNIDNSIRIGQFKPETVRIVIQNKNAYNCNAYQPIFAKKKYHIPLPKKSNKLPAVRYKRPKVNVHVSSRPKHLQKNKKRITKVSVSPNSRSHELIVIDAGHGGHDTGAIGGGKREKDLVLSIAKKVANALKKQGFPVYLTRGTDRFLKLSQRTHIADVKGATAFISIHANSVPRSKRNSVHGIETFFLQNTRDAKSQRIAARENVAVLKGAGSRLSKEIIVDSVLNGPKIVQSNKLAIDVQSHIISKLQSHYKGIKDGGVRHAPFYVLVGASRPSILVEVGYISHPLERKRLFMPSYQNLIAQGIAQGVTSYLNNRKQEIDF